MASPVWVTRMRESMARLTQRFSASRTVREYTQQCYLPALEGYLERAADKGALGVQIVQWRHTLDRKWASLRFGEVKVESAGQKHTFEVHVFLDDIDPDSVGLELYADRSDGHGPIRQEMARVRKLVGSVKGYAYSASVPTTRPATDYTPRAVPHFPHVAVPLEASQILWQR